MGSEQPSARVALATCAELPELDPETRRLLAPLRARGVSASPAVWSDTAVDWRIFDLVVVRCCWDYVQRREDFLAWSRTVPQLANPANVLAWNTDKRYLRELERKGVPTAPTQWIAPDCEFRWPAEGEWVVKPAVSIASLDTGRYDLADPDQRRQAEEHVARLHRQFRTVMVQPYFKAVDVLGESSLVFLDGVFSHAIRKEGLLAGPDDGRDRRFEPSGGQTIRSHAPSAAELELAAQALAAAPERPEDLLYARVDLIPDQRGRPLLMEFELVEPMLYLGAGSLLEKFADAIAIRAIKHRRESGPQALQPRRSA